MLDESDKRKLRQLWYKRLGISFGLIVGLGFSFATALPGYSKVPKISKVEILELETELQLVEKMSWQLSRMEELAEANVALCVSIVTTYTKKLVQLKAKETASNNTCGELYSKKSSVSVIIIHWKDKTDINISTPNTYIDFYKKIGTRPWWEIFEPDKKEKNQSSLMLLVLSILGCIILALLLRQRIHIFLTFPSKFIYFIPEECVAELEALSQQLKSNNSSDLLVNMIILASFIELIFALYVQINIDNFWLPSQKNKNK